MKGSPAKPSKPEEKSKTTLATTGILKKLNITELLKNVPKRGSIFSNNEPSEESNTDFKICSFINNTIQK